MPYNIVATLPDNATFYDRLTLAPSDSLLVPLWAIWGVVSAMAVQCTSIQYHIFFLSFFKLFLLFFFSCPLYLFAFWVHFDT